MEDVELRVVVGVDGSDSARLAVEWAAREARALQAPLEVLHAWTVPPPVYGDGPRVAERPFFRDAEATLDGTIDWLRASGKELPELRPQLVAGNTVDALLDAGEHAALLVVGSRGRGGFAGLLLGSVSQAVLHHARCPVAIVPHPHTGE